MSSSTQFRRVAQRDDRRRRLMADEGLADAPVLAPGSMRTRAPSEHKTQNYGDAEFLSRQPRLIDLVPQQRWMLGLWFGVGVTVIAALELACLYLCGVGGGKSGITAIFDFSRKDCLGNWLGEIILIATAIACALVYSIRRHRTDDYQGRYRVWTWAAAGWFYLAADKSANIHEALQNTLVQLSGTKLIGNGELWWIIPYLLVSGAIVTRLFWDLRESWPTWATLSAAATAYAFALALRLTAAPDVPILRQAMLEQGAELGGHWLSLLAVCIYLRHVLRDAEGLVPRREAKPVQTGVDKQEEVGENAASVPVEAAKPATASGQWGGVDPPHLTPPAPVQSRPADAPTKPAVVAPSTPIATVEAEPHADHKMTKAEKKALKERLMRQQLERQHQQSAKWSK